MYCPICSKKLEVDRDMMDGWLLMYEEKKCPTGHWVYVYDTGYTTYYIGDEIAMSYSYNESERFLKLYNMVYNIKIKIAKLRWSLYRE